MPLQRRTLAGVVALLVAGTACGSAQDGRDRATDQARAAAATTRTVVAEAAAAPSAKRGNALAAALRTAVGDSQDRRIVFGSSSDTDGTVHLLVAFDGFDESGGGGTFRQVRTRLCVEFVVPAGPAPEVELRDHACSLELLEPTAPTRRADLVVTLG